MEPDYIRTEILPEFFRNFWVRRMALDRRNYRAAGRDHRRPRTQGARPACRKPSPCCSD